MLKRKEWSGYALHWGGHYFDAAFYRRISPPQYANVGWLGAYERERLLIPRTSPRIEALYTEGCLFASNNFFVATLRSGGSVDELALVFAYLNSSLPTSLHRLRYPRSDKLFPEVKIQHLVDLPVPLDAVTASRQDRRAALDCMLDASKGRLTADEVREACEKIAFSLVAPSVLQALRALAVEESE